MHHIDYLGIQHARPPESRTWPQRRACTIATQDHSHTASADTRHACAMRLLHAGVDTSVIALWLGHESVDTTQIYLHADLELKEKALARTKPPTGRAGRYQPTDSLIAWLEGL